MSTEEETAYQKIWKRMREELNVKASDYVPQMYNALIQDGYTPKEARDKIKKDCFNIWKVETIDKWIPVEAKQIIKVLAGQKGGISKSEEDKKRSLLDSQSSKNKADGESKDEENPEKKSQPSGPIIRTPEAPDNSMVEQLNHINIQLKKKIEDLEKLMEIRMADKDQRIEQFTILNIGMKKDVERLMDENMKLKSEKQKLETELAKYKRMEELRLAVQRKAIKQWNSPGDKP